MVGDRLEFEVLQQRIHPATSRVEAARRGDASQLRRLRPPRARRRRLHAASVRRAARAAGEALADAAPPIHLTPATTRSRPGAGVVRAVRGRRAGRLVAKPLDGTYEPDKRMMFKIKHARTADCVVAGYRVHTSGPEGIGSLLLGLYTDDGDAAVGRCHRRVPGRPPQGAVHRDAAAGHHVRGPPVGVGQRGVARARRAAANTAAGTSARTCRSCRCDPSGWSRSATSTWRAAGSGTPRNSIAGDPTATRARARTPSSRNRSSYDLADIFGTAPS